MIKTKLFVATLLLAALPAWAQHGGGTGPSPLGGGGGGGAPSFPLLGGDGCVTPPYSFTNDTDMGACRGLAAVWGFDSLVLQGNDYETDFVGNYIQMPGSGEFILMGANDASFNTATIYLQHPITGTLWSSFVFTAADYTTGTGASVLVSGTATSAGVGSFTSQVDSDASLVSVFEQFADETFLDYGDDDTYELISRATDFKLFADDSGGSGLYGHVWWDISDDGDSEGKLEVTDGNDVGSASYEAGQITWTASVDGGGEATIEMNDSNISLAQNDGSDTSDVTVTGGTGIKITTDGSRPTCDANARGYLFRVEGGSSVADTFEVCAKNSSDTYAWYVLATIP